MKRFNSIEYYIIRNGKGLFLKEDGGWTKSLMKARTFDKDIDTQFYLKRGRNLWGLESWMNVFEGRAQYDSKLVKI